MKLVKQQLDLRSATALIRKHIVEWVGSYRSAPPSGPGKRGAPVTQLTLGYQFDQAGWIALVGDTRPKATADGAWNSFIEPNALSFAEWPEAFTRIQNGAAVTVLRLDGTRKAIGADAFAECLGTMIRDALIAARDDGELAALPLAAKCNLVVEEHDGGYGWSDQAAAHNDEAAFVKQLEGDVASKSIERQIVHWIRILEKLASGEFAGKPWAFIADDHAISRVQKFGDNAVIPLLEFVRRWACKPELDGDRPKRSIAELPMSGPTIKGLMLVWKSNCHSAEAERLLRDIVRRSVEANAQRKLWGSIPMWAARCLSKLFDGYPEPIQNERTNELVNPDAFTGKRGPNR